MTSGKLICEPHRNTIMFQTKKIANTQAHLRFLNICKKEGLAPPGFITKSSNPKLNKKLEPRFVYKRMVSYIGYLHHHLTELTKKTTMK